jgi:pyruvate kinase
MKQPEYSWRRTKIVCTLGPVTHSSEMIERLIRAGMDVARLNLSHGTLEEHARYVNLVRTIGQRMNRNIAVLIDLPGPKYRIGKLQNGCAFLKKGAVVTITIKDVTGNSELLPVNLPYLTADVKIGDAVLLVDGELELKVEKINADEIKCRVVSGGNLPEASGVVVPRRHMSAPYITEAMEKDIDFAITQKPDYIALSFVSDSYDITEVRKILRSKHIDIPLISKIEREEAVGNFNKILAASDAIMVARGDLGVEIPLEKVPLVQKEVIRKCNRAGKPVITATEMLESMVNSPTPTRAETTDVANAIFDGTDAVMLSAETAVGKYPVQAVTMMSKIAREAEKVLPYEQMLNERGAWNAPETDEIISYNACNAAFRLNAAAIVAYTQSGSTARRVSKYRPRVPILALTPDDCVYHCLILCWGVFPVKADMPSTVDEMFAVATDTAKDIGLVKKGDLIVTTAGIPIGQAGSTNMLKVEEVG